MNDNEMQVQIVPQNYARLNVTYAGMNGYYPDPVPYDATDGDIRAIAAEAIRTGYIPGITAANAQLTDFIVDRFPPTADVPVARLVLRPKTPFG